MYTRKQPLITDAVKTVRSYVKLVRLELVINYS